MRFDKVILRIVLEDILGTVLHQYAGHIIFTTLHFLVYHIYKLLITKDIFCVVSKMHSCSCKLVIINYHY